MRSSSLLKTAHKALGAGKYEEAAALADKLISQGFKPPKPLFIKALALHELERSTEARALLEEASGIEPRNHFSFLLAALVAYDLGDFDEAARSVENARRLSHQDNFVVSGLRRLIDFKRGGETERLSEFHTCPSVYNELVGPRLLLVLEEAVLKSRDSLDTAKAKWARLEEEKPSPTPRSLRTLIPFVLLRVPVLIIQRLFGRPTMPLQAEEAYLRGDLDEVSRILREEEKNARKKRKTFFRESRALICLNREEFRECLNLLPTREKEPDPFVEFVRGYCLLHTGRWKRAARAFEDAADQPLAHYFRGLCLAAAGKSSEARRAFTLEIRRNDIAIAERILLAGRLLEIFPAGDRTTENGERTEEKIPS